MNIDYDVDLETAEEEQLPEIDQTNTKARVRRTRYTASNKWFDEFNRLVAEFKWLIYGLFALLVFGLFIVWKKRAIWQRNLRYK